MHVLTNVLKQPSDGPLARALDEAGINEMNDLLTLDHQSRNALTYKLDDGTVKPLPIGYRNLLRVLKIFADYCQDKGMPIDDWTAVTKRDFDDFRTSRDSLALSEKSDSFSISASNPVISPTPYMPTPKQKDLLSEFKKGIKRDASLFVILKDLKQWDSWHRSTVAQVRAQDVYDVLDPAYKPSPTDKDLFKAKQKYMYAVFERVLQMDKGKALVRSNETTSDAQLIVEELCQDALCSTRASIDSSRLLSYITSVRIGDGMWNRTSHGFILHWQEQVQLYESLVDTASHFSSEQKMHMLQNAIHPEEELRQVKNQADQLQAFHGKGIGYNSDCNLLLSAASNLDAKHALKGRMGSTKKNVYVHDLGNYGDEKFHDAYNLDCDIGGLQANVHKQQPKQGSQVWPKWDVKEFL